MTESPEPVEPGEQAPISEAAQAAEAMEAREDKILMELDGVDEDASPVDDTAPGSEEP